MEAYSTIFIIEDCMHHLLNPKKKKNISYHLFVTKRVPYIKYMASLRLQTSVIYI